MAKTASPEWTISGRTCLITGANTGIGRAAAFELARRGAKLVLACRSESKTRPVIDELRRETGAEVDFLALDLSSLAAVRRSAAEYLAREQPLHVLIDNAGLAGQRGITSDGFELAFGVNHLGHFLFTNLLLDRLKESAPARVVVVASHSHYQAKQIDLNAVRGRTKSVTGISEYEVSKAANVLFAAELARRLEGTGVTVYSLHPGMVASDVWRRVPWPVRTVMKRWMKTVEQGAETIVYCASAPELSSESGLYYTDCAKKHSSRLTQDPELAAELWRRSEAWVSG